MLVTYNVQAVWLTEILRGKVKLPSIKDMQDDTDERKSILRKRMAIPTFVSAHLQSTIPFVDLMIQEMGLRHRRKRNLFAEWFLPYTNESIDSNNVLIHLPMYHLYPHSFCSS